MQAGQAELLIGQSFSVAVFLGFSRQARVVVSEGRLRADGLSTLSGSRTGGNETSGNFTTRDIEEAPIVSVSR
jgi:hypothetical protein